MIFFSVVVLFIKIRCRLFKKKNNVTSESLFVLAFCFSYRVLLNLECYFSLKWSSPLILVMQNFNNWEDLFPTRKSFIVFAFYIGLSMNHGKQIHFKTTLITIH